VKGASVHSDRRKLRAWGAEVLVADSGSAADQSPPVVVLHGEEGPDAVRTLVGLLPGSSRVLTITHPGFDRRSRVPGVDRPQELAYLYLDLLDELGITECSLVGASLGAWVALEAAVMEPRRFTSVTVIGPVGAKFNGLTDRSFAEVLVAAPDAIRATLYADPAMDPWQGRTSTDEVVERAEYRESFMHYVWEPYLHNPRLPGLLPRITAPVLVVAGDEDRLVERGYYESLAECFPDARLERVVGAGHYPEIEKPAETAELVAKFIAANDPAVPVTAAGRDSR
jgi:pimeloyl-ACP methyl ester carboxylesterase